MEGDIAAREAGVLQHEGREARGNAVLAAAVGTLHGGREDLPKDHGCIIDLEHKKKKKKKEEKEKFKGATREGRETQVAP